ncbi:MAG: hypothetical protein D6717_07655 [Gammaproteobacteria bacterium]|nr:MAG: hypothetical protein D6717_07655 [Gammaproteobacteria bacterium]
MRRILSSLILACLLLAVAPAPRAAVYQDYTASPFVKMMLLMMDMFGLLDRLPRGYGYYPGPYAGQYGLPGQASWGDGWTVPGVNPFTQPGFAGFPPVQSPYVGDANPVQAPNAVEPWAPIEEAAPGRTAGIGLNGIWQGQAGDMMAIYGDRFVWSDPRNRALSGRFRIQGDYIVARVAGSAQPLVFRVQKVPGGFIAMDASGRAVRFRRLY